ncbi:MAG: SusC/RagA family TonB-linked outer membrane protein [Balneolaceae bacterium]|nr:SusC/RagA family TonB-linked outer membrane protein [Balneolaceae bacterium]
MEVSSMNALFTKLFNRTVWYGLLGTLLLFFGQGMVMEANGQYLTSVSQQSVSQPYYSVELYADQISELRRIISVDMKNAARHKVLEAIVSKAELGLAYNAELISLKQPVTFKEEYITVAKALQKVLKGTGYEAVISKTREILLKKKMALPVVKNRQEISGVVTDAETGEVMPGVNVFVKNTQVGTSTNAQGRYTLNVPADADTLIFSFIGYKREKVAIGNKTTIDVEISREAQAFDELVVTSFGIEQEKKSLGYSVQEISSEEIAKSGETNIVGALQGKLAGVNIQNTSGAAGAGMDITIRGISSLSPSGDNQPLFVVDGVPVSNETSYGNVLPSEGTNSPGSAEQFSFSNRGADINPEDIENISILKGPAATALYGQRAANGVVEITTKKGESGNTQVALNTQVGFSEVNKVPEIQDDYQHGYYGALPYRVFGYEFWQYGPPTTESSKVYNNYKRFFQTSTNISNSLSISGGNNSTTYFTSVSNVNEEGVVPNTEWGRTTFKLTGSHKISEAFDISGSVNYSNSGGVRPTGGDKSIMSSLSYWTPSNDINDYKYPDGNQKNYSGFRDDLNSGFIDNPRYFAEHSTLKDDVNRIIGNMRMSYDFADWLSVDYTFGADYYNDSRERFVPPNLDVGTQVNGFIVKEQINYTQLNSNLYVRASRSFTDRLSGSVVLGNQVTDISSDRLNTRGEGLNINGFRSLANTTNIFTTEVARQRRLVGVFADAKLEYDGTYFLTVTGRNDWSSTLPEDNRSFFYPSVSLGYIFTEDLGLANSDWLPFGKLRFSWAKVGKDAPPYSVGQYFEGASGFPFSGTGGFSKDTRAGDPNLKPEITTSYELGTDLRFFNNRLRLDLTYFKQASKNQIVAFPVSNPSGLSRYTTNAGEIQGEGVEVLLNGTPFRQQDFSWDVSVNWSSVSSEVTEMPEGLDVIEFANSGFPGVVSRIQEGGEMGDLYGYKFEYTDKGELLIGDDGLPTIRTDTLVKVGNALPDWQGGITNNFNYKGLSLSFLIEVRMGADAYDSGQRNSIRNGILEITKWRNDEVIFQGVTSNGSPNDKPVRIGQNLYRSSTSFNRASEILVQDASWIRLRNVRLSYELPSRLTQKLSVASASFSISGRNLFLNTPFRGFDPEGQQYSAGSNTYGFTGLNIPPTRSLSFSMNLKF